MAGFPPGLGDSVQGATAARVGASTGVRVGAGAGPTRLAPFEVPVHFVFRGRARAWPDLFDGSPLPDPDAIPQRIVEVEECWIAQTFLRLRQAGLVATISEHARPDAINVVSYHDLAIRDLDPGAYVVAAQSDSPRPEICDRRVVQNELGVLAHSDHYIPHWPQPGLIPRDRSRGARIETLAFKGAENNLYSAFRSPEFETALAALGVRLVFDLKDEPAGQAEATIATPPLRWHDYRDTDLVLAVRDATTGDLRLKPASKLVNAWRAGSPALLGPEPAFQALRRDGLDYFEIRTPEDAIGAVRRLKEEPGLFEAMVRNGHERASEFTVARITSLWHALLSGPAVRDFARLRQRPAVVQRLLRWPLFGARAILHKRNRRRYQHERDHGFRPISARHT